MTTKALTRALAAEARTEFITGLLQTAVVIPFAVPGVPSETVEVTPAGDKWAVLHHHLFGVSEWTGSAWRTVTESLPVTTWPLVDALQHAADAIPQLAADHAAWLAARVRANSLADVVEEFLTPVREMAEAVS